MRLLLLGVILTLAACGTTNNQQEIVPSSKGDLSLERTQTRFETTKSTSEGGTRITLRNTDFQTPRRIERALPRIALKSNTPTQDLILMADKSLQTFAPDTEFKFVSLNKGARFAYATFQQIWNGLEVYGARIVLRLNGEGDWITTNSTLVNPSLLKDLPSPTHFSAPSSRYFSMPHEILRERSVIFPRLNEMGKMQMHRARELVAFSLDQHQEFWIWVDEASEKIIGAYNPAEGLDTIQVKGSILPNAEGDNPIEVLFPQVTALLDPSEKLLSDANGLFQKSALLNKNPKIVLENDFVAVFNNAKTSREYIVDPALALDSVNIDQGPSLEDRNAFYWVMQARKFVVENLKYDGMNYKLGVYTNYGDHLDNAFFMPLTKTLSLGAGGKFLKNTALSKDVVIHEFGHAVTQAIYGTVQSYEFNAMNEAFSDYLAATITNDPLIADGSMQERTGMKYLRTVENDFEFPKSFSGVKFHEDGQMFSGALWDIRKSLGQAATDQLVHEARLAQAKTIPEFLLHLLDIDERADDHNPWTPSKNNAVIWKSFMRHGLVSDVSFTKAPDENLTIPWKRPGCFSLD